MGKVLQRKGAGIPGNDALVQDEEERIEDEESEECKIMTLNRSHRVSFSS